MTTRHWVKRIRIADQSSLSAVLSIADLRIAESSDAFWLRGDRWDDRIDAVVRSIPGEPFWIDESQRLIPFGRELPVEKLPLLDWQLLNDMIDVRLPEMHAVPRDLQFQTRTAAAGERAELRLVRTSSPRVPNALLTSLDNWHAFVVQAPQFRLRRLAYACHRDRRILVYGESLPPISGQRLVERNWILTPAGFAWSPAVDAWTVRKAFGVPDQNWLLWLSADQVESFPREAFVQASRSSVRATLELFTEARE